jgi:DNA invertase Pin-like site-specific DNA recombinase
MSVRQKPDTISGATPRRRRAVGYVRVASLSQADPRSALDGQAARVQAIARDRGLELIGIVEDGGKSAFDMSREGLNAILAAAAARRFDVVIVRDWARLARDPDDLQHILDSLAAGGVAVVHGAE